VKHPRLGLRRLPETIGDQSLPGRLEELLDLWLCEFLPESRRFLRVEVSSLLILTYFSDQLDMPVAQRLEHLAEDIEKLVIAGLASDFVSVDFVLPLPIDIPQCEKWIPVVKGLPQLFEILFRVVNDHDSLAGAAAALGEPKPCVFNRSIAGAFLPGGHLKSRNGTRRPAFWSAAILGG